MGGHTGSRQRMGQSNRNRPRAGAYVDDVWVGIALETLQHSFHQMLRFRTGNQNCRRDLERQAKKFLKADDVLKRLRSQAAPDKPFELTRFSGRKYALRMSQQAH